MLASIQRVATADNYHMKLTSTECLDNLTLFGLLTLISSSNGFPNPSSSVLQYDCIPPLELSGTSHIWIEGGETLGLSGNLEELATGRRQYVQI